MRGLIVTVAVALTAGCEEDPDIDLPDKEVCLDRSDGSRYCIDVYEASRRDAMADTAGGDEESPAKSLEGRIPWFRVNWSEAKAACERRDRRLCDADEWIDACDGRAGDGGTVYAYGDGVDATRCNTGGTGAAPGASFGTCLSVAKTFDQSGNLWEWTGQNAGAATVRGGGFRSTQTHRCSDTLANTPVTAESEEIGFRCCRSL